MKTMKSLIVSSFALAVAFGAWLPLQSQAADQIKGAQKLLQPSQARPLSAGKATETAMACPKCKDVAVEKVNVEKGHIRTVTAVVNHLCPGCSTTIGVKGVGKAKVDVATHSCAMDGKAASCCK